MTTTGFYDTAEPGFGDQMDPLGTAKPAEAAAERPAAPASVTIGKTKVKKKMSTGKKIAIGGGGFLAAFLALVIVLDSAQPKISASPKPHAPIPAPSNPGQMMGAEAAGSATVMGGAPAPAAQEVADQSKTAVLGAAQASQSAAATAATAAAPAAAAAQASAPAPAAAAPAPAGAAAAPAAAQAAAAAPAATAAAPAPATPATPVAGAPASAPVAESSASSKSHGKAHSAAKADVQSATPEQLASRVAVLERRLARYERAEAHERARSVKEAVARTKPAATEKVLPVAQPIVEAKKTVALANDTVRVVGVSTHHGVTTALVDFGGVKSRVAAGDPIPGLGTVQSVAVDAAGNPVVEINGVRYQ